MSHLEEQDTRFTARVLSPGKSLRARGEFGETLLARLMWALTGSQKPRLSMKCCMGPGDKWQLIVPQQETRSQGVCDRLPENTADKEEEGRIMDSFYYVSLVIIAGYWLSRSLRNYRQGIVSRQFTQFQRCRG